MTPRASQPPLQRPPVPRLRELREASLAALQEVLPPLSRRSLAPQVSRSLLGRPPVPRLREARAARLTAPRRAPPPLFSRHGWHPRLALRRTVEARQPQCFLLSPRRARRALWHRPSLRTSLSSSS